MTAEMPRTKPNIMITARLLLIPVLSSVELKACARAGRVLRVRKAAATRSEGSRERTLGLFFCRQRLFRRTRDDNLTSAQSVGVCPTQHARSVPARNQG